MDFEIVTEGLHFPEGPVWMSDGSILVVDCPHGRITRVLPDGSQETVAEPGGQPSGLAIGPDGALYVCNGGGTSWWEADGLLLTMGDASDDYVSGRIDRIDLATGRVDRLYDRVDGRLLAAPNDLVFDAFGGIWFSDLGKRRDSSVADGGIFYALPDGSSITRVVDRVQANGIGLSPDGKTLYAAMSHDRLLVAYDIVAPGQLDLSGMIPGRVVASYPGRQLLDSLAVMADGQVCVATVFEKPGISTVDPISGETSFFPCPDLLTTNICFGGVDMRDAWITLSATGKLLRTRWDSPGLKLAYNA